MIIAITTAPREIPTLNVCIKALRSAGYNEKIYIFAEPGAINIDADNVEICIHPEKKGAFNNYDFVLNWFLTQEDEELLIMQDDLIVSKNFMDIINVRGNAYGYYNLLTVTQNQEVINLLKKKGWNKSNIGRWAWGACYLMRKEVIERIIKHDYYIKHKAGKSDGNKGEMIDGCISQCLLLMDLPMWYHNPSLTQHVGVSSTLNHKGILTGYKWMDITEITE